MKRENLESLSIPERTPLRGPPINYLKINWSIMKKTMIFLGLITGACLFYRFKHPTDNSSISKNNHKVDVIIIGNVKNPDVYHLDANANFTIYDIIGICGGINKISEEGVAINTYDAVIRNSSGIIARVHRKDWGKPIPKEITSFDEKTIIEFPRTK